MFARRMLAAATVTRIHWTTTHRLALAALLGQLFVYLPGVTPYLLARGLTIAQINGLQTVYIVSQLLLEVPTGVVADRFGRRWSCILAAVALVVAECIFLLARDYPTFVLAQVFTGMGFALASGSREALVYESLPPDNRAESMQRASGLIGAASQAGNLLAYAAGGFFLAAMTVGRISAAVVATILFLLAALAVTATVREPSVPRGAVGRIGMAGTLGDGLRLLRRDRVLRRIVLLAILTQPFGAYLLFLYQARFLELGVPGAWFGFSLALGSGIGVLGQRYAYLLPMRLGARRAVLLATVAPGPVYLLMAVTTRPVLAVALFCVLWGIILVAPSLLSGYTNARIPDGFRATALSLISLLIAVYLAALGPILGTIADRSVAAAFAVMGTFVIVGGMIVPLDGVGRGEASEPVERLGIARMCNTPGQQPGSSTEVLR